MTQPTKDIYVWAENDVILPTANRPNKKKPQDSLILTGWDQSQKPAADEWNDILNRVTLWIKYLKDTTDSPFLQKINNLSDLTNITQSRNNLDVYSKNEVNSKRITTGAGLTGGGDFSNDRVISMATPSTVGAGSANSATNSGSPTHTHALDATGNVSILTGSIVHGGTIPLPAGYTESQCKWMVSVNSLSSGPSANDIDEFSCSAIGTRVVTCMGSNIDGSFNGTANYIIIGVK